MADKTNESPFQPYKSPTAYNTSDTTLDTPGLVDEVNETQEEENMLVPISAWKKVLDQLGNLHEADMLMAEARERAAKAEAESEFLREKLKNTREELNTFKKKKRFFFF